MAARKTTKKPAKRAVKSAKASRAQKSASKTRSAAKKKPAAKKLAARRPAAKKSAARRPAAKKPAAKKLAAKRVEARPKAVQRRDHDGHIDPAYAAELRAQSAVETSDDRAFFRVPRTTDDLAEELGEDAVNTMTTGENDGEDRLDQLVTEEEGGPFVETTASEEFANDIDESNPESATREPFPKT